MRVRGELLVAADANGDNEGLYLNGTLALRAYVMGNYAKFIRRAGCASTWPTLLKAT